MHVDVKVKGFSKQECLRALLSSLPLPPFLPPSLPSPPIIFLAGKLQPQGNKPDDKYNFVFKTVNLGDRELSAMMNESWTQANAPLLVLSTVSMLATPSLSCATVVELLQLRRFNRPWQVSFQSVSLVRVSNLKHSIFFA